MLLFLHALAHAQDAVSLELVQRAQQGIDLPKVSVIANVNTEALTLELRCGQTPVSATGQPRAGQRLEVEIPLSTPGPAHCSGSLALTLPDGAQGSMPLAFDVELLAPIEIVVDPQSVDVESQTLSLSLSREANRVEVTASGLDGEVGQGSLNVQGIPAGSTIALPWSQTDGAEVLRLHVKAEDQDGFWSAVDLFPWSYAIPHEDVVFNTNEATIQDSENEKLTAAMEEIVAVQQKYGQHAEINLFVAGYTDTVGDAASNRTLSAQRARAIAAWFQQAGFSGTIYFQGFGEAGQLVATGDNVDEPANRRAAYIIAAQPPPASPMLPTTQWTAL